MLSLPPITLAWRGWKLIEPRRAGFSDSCALRWARARLALVLRQRPAGNSPLETYRPDVVNRSYRMTPARRAASRLQRRILETYEQCPRSFITPSLPSKDQHFEEHWGIDFPRMASAAFQQSRQAPAITARQHHHHGNWRNLIWTAAPQLRPNKMQEICWRCRSSGATPSRKFSRCTPNQVYPSTRNYISRLRRNFYSGKAAPNLKLQEAALLAAWSTARNFAAHESGTRAQPPQRIRKASARGQSVSSRAGAV